MIGLLDSIMATLPTLFACATVVGFILWMDLISRHECLPVSKEENKIRYVRQRDLFSCGPIAIINAIKWAGGKHATYKSLPYMQELCKTVYRDEDSNWQGTAGVYFSQAIRRASRGLFRVAWEESPKWETVRNHLLQKRAICVLYKYSDFASHYCLFVGLTDKEVIGVNHCREDTTRKITMKSLRKLLRKGKIRGSIFPEVWFLTRLK